jgi:hypothetical protein
MSRGPEQIKQAMSAIPSVDNILGSPIGIEIESSLGTRHSITSDP